ncbi:MFS transporter [Aquincola sp. MAHUQ-54]|uniref:MFS transporter n=1 Tax=Aquincola agrisoli TaxID=3119538 RepID=A0AAW9QQ45_9BURK
MPNPIAAPRHEAAALAGLSLSMLLSSLATSIVPVGLPHLALAFGAPFPQVQWVLIAYLLALTTLVVGAGRLGDVVGRRRLLLAGVAVFTAASALCSAAPTLGWLVAARAAQGAGAAAMLALTMAFVGQAVPRARTGSAMGLLGTASAVGTALGPSLGGLLLAGPGWRALFAAIAPLGLLAWWLLRRHLPADPQAPHAGRQGLDPTGTLLLASTLAAYALAMTLGGGRAGALTIALLLAAAAGAALFVRAEARAASPLVRLSMFRDRLLRKSLVTNALVATVMMATLVVGPFYLSRTLGLGAAGVGLVLSVGPMVAAAAGVPAGRLADRFGAPGMTLAGLAAIGAGAAALSMLPATLGIAGYLVPIVVITAGYALFQAANNTAVMAGVRPDERGVLSGLLGLSRNLGLITGAAVMGAVFERASAAADVATAPAAAVAGGMHMTFGVAGVLMVAAGGAAARCRT